MKGPKRILIGAYYQVLEMLQDPVVIWNPEDGVLYANQQTTRLLGFSLDEMLDMDLADLLGAKDILKHTQALKSLVNGGVDHISMDTVIRSKEGKKIPVELVEAMTLAGSGTVIYSTVIKELMGVQRQLKDQIERIAALTKRVEKEYPHVHPTA